MVSLKKPLLVRTATALFLIAMTYAIASGNETWDGHLAVKKQLPVAYDASLLPSQSTPAWFPWVDGPLDEAELTELVDGGLLRATVPVGSRLRWVDLTADGFGTVNPDVGFTIEIRMSVLSSEGRGIDIQPQRSLFDRHIVRINTDTVAVAGGWIVQTSPTTGLDNSSQLFTIRIAVDDLGMAYIYRDGVLLGVSAGINSAGQWDDQPHLMWGQGEIAGSAEALFDYVTYDLSGAYKP